MFFKLLLMELYFFILFTTVCYLSVEIPLIFYILTLYSLILFKLIYSRSFVLDSLGFFTYIIMLSERKDSAHPFLLVFVCTLLHRLGFPVPYLIK